LKKVILSADSTCDLSDDLIQKYDVKIQPLHINLDEVDYRDGIDITPDDIYAIYQEKGMLPKTSAPNPIEYIEHFKKWTDQGYAVIHISLGSGISSSHQNSLIAASDLPDVYSIDSGNLSTGMGLLVIEAAERIEQGMDAAQIYQELNELKHRVHASFVIDKLTYLYEGGRCSALANISANLLNIKPSIQVDNTTGKMAVGKKYRGSLLRVLKHYTEDQLQDGNRRPCEQRADAADAYRFCEKTRKRPVKPYEQRSSGGGGLGTVGERYAKPEAEKQSGESGKA